MKRGINLIFCCAALLCLASCGSEVEPMNAQRLAQLSELGTVEYTVSKVVKATDNKNILAVFGSRKIIFNTTSTLKAGFDMTEITDEDIVCSRGSKKIEVTLPQPKLLSLNMKAEDIKLAYEESTGLRGDFSPEERTALQAQGEEDIRNSVDELGILDDAKKFGKEFFESFLKQCGYEDITINFKQN